MEEMFLGGGFPLLMHTAWEAAGDTSATQVGHLDWVLGS